MDNIQQLTLGIEYPAVAIRSLIGCWVFGFECRLFAEIRARGAPGASQANRFLDCGGKPSATPFSWLQTRQKSGVAAALCHRSPKYSHPDTQLRDSNPTP